LGNKYERLWTNGCFGGDLFFIFYFFLKKFFLWIFVDECKMNFIKKKLSFNAKWENWPGKKFIKHIKKKNWIKKNLWNFFFTINLNMLLSLGITKTMFNSMIWKDKYERVLTWNCQIGHDIIDYAKIPLIRTMIFHHWNFI